MGGESSTSGGGERCIQEFVGNRDRKRPLEEPGEDGRIILK